MLQFTATQRTIINLLADGSCQSGTALGKKLNITRSAIWKQINQLIELGVPIISIPNQGYQFKTNLIVLDEQKIKKQLVENNWSKSLNIHLFSSIDSTNRYLKDLPPSPQLEICCAEMQTQGRGRFGRHWHSPFGENIYFSSRWNLHCDLSKLSGLSLVISLAVVASLKKFHPSPTIKIKWPNDILWKDKKLCGSLIEINAESNASAQVVIGIGLNVNSDTENNPLPDKDWCSLFELTKQLQDRNELIAQLIIHLEHYLTLFIDNGLQFFINEWHQYDYLLNKTITVTQFGDSLTGIACGINAMGHLILQDSLGTKHLLSSGDTTLKPV